MNYHCVTAQYLQVRTLKQSMAEKTEAMVQMDYDENWACNYQDDMAAVYYSKCQW